MKPTLIILPGWGGTKQSWEKFCDMAREYFEVVCLELPCFGSEPCPEAVWGVEDYAEFVEKKLKNFSGKINLLGHSFGGQVAVQLVANNRELVDKLILSGAAIYRPKKGIKRAIFGVMTAVGKLIFKLPLLKYVEDPARKILYKIAKSPDYVKTDGIKRDIFRKIIRQEVSDSLEKINNPTLVVWGEKDGYVPLSQGKKIFQKIGGAKFEVIKDGKHGLHIQKTKELIKLVKNFIS